MFFFFNAVWISVCRIIKGSFSFFSPSCMAFVFSPSRMYQGSSYCQLPSETLASLQQNVVKVFPFQFALLCMLVRELFWLNIRISAGSFKRRRDWNI